jgi:hypothetical protein
VQTVGVSGGEVGTAKTEPRELLTLRRSAPARPSCHFGWVPTTPHFRQGDRCCSAKSNGFGKGPSLSAHSPQRRPDRGAVPRDEEGGTDDWTARGERMDDVSEVLSSEVFRGNAYSLENELSAFPHSAQYHAITCGSFEALHLALTARTFPVHGVSYSLTSECERAIFSNVSAARRKDQLEKRRRTRQREKVRTCL